MSVQEFIDHRGRILAILNGPTPECWAIIANSVFGSAEDSSILALFDTCAQAEAYVEAAKLPKEFKRRRTRRYSVRP